SGTQYFRPKLADIDSAWDWGFEDPDRYAHSPFQWKSYNALSLDAALAVQQALPEELGGIRIDWRRWTKAVHSEMMQLIRYRQLPKQVQQDFLQAVSSVPAGNAFSWRWRTLRLAWKTWLRRPPADELARGVKVFDDAVE